MNPVLATVIVIAVNIAIVPIVVDFKTHQYSLKKTVAVEHDGKECLNAYLLHAESSVPEIAHNIC